MNNHNLYIYSNFDFSKKSAGSTRLRYYAKALASNSNNVYLVSCCDNKFTDENFDEIEPNIFLLERKNVTTNFIKTFSFIKRLDSFANRKTSNYTFIFYPYPLVSLELLALIYLKGYKKRSLFYELNEVRKHTSSFHAPLSLKKIKYSLKKIIYKSVFTLMQLLLYFYDGLICISTSIEQYARKYNKNTLRIPILTDPNILIESSGKNYRTQSKFNIGFSGSIHPSKENLKDFLEVLSRVKKSGHCISFNLCGNISDSYLKYLLQDCNLKDEIYYYGNLNEIELSTFLSQQDLLVIPRGFTLQNKYGFSTKLSDYFNHKKIVLLTDVSDNGLFIEDGVNGFIVQPNNKEQMFKKLTFIIQNYNSVKKVIIPNTLKTSQEVFDYSLYRNLLRNFLLGK